MRGRVVRMGGHERLASNFMGTKDGRRAVGCARTKRQSAAGSMPMTNGTGHPYTGWRVRLDAHRHPAVQASSATSAAGTTALASKRRMDGSATNGSEPTHRA